MIARVVLFASFALVAVGCKKPEDTSATAAPTGSGAAPTIAVNGGTVSTREEDGLTRYSDEGPESGTVLTVKSIHIRKAADQSSDILTSLGPNTGVNKKARHGAYYLVDYPTGTPGQMKSGWLEQTDVTAQPHLPVATTTVPPPTLTTPPKIVIPGKH